MKRWILRIVLALVILVVGGVAVGWAMLDTLAKKGIEQGGRFALGEPTDVNEVQLSPLTGTLMIDKLKIGNPQGFSSPHLLQTGRFDLAVRPMSVIGGPVDVQKFSLDGLDVNIDQLLKGNNISVVLERIKKLGGEGDKEAPKPEDEGTKVHVGTLVIKNVVARVHLPVGGPAGDLTIRLPAIEMTDVTKDSPEGVTIGQLVMRIVPAVLASILEAGKDVIPADLAAVLNSDVAGAARAVGDQAVKLAQQAGEEAARQAMVIGEAAAKQAQQVAGEAARQAQQLGGAAAKTVGQAGETAAQAATQAAEGAVKGIEKGVGEVGKGVGEVFKGLLGGDKPKEPAEAPR